MEESDVAAQLSKIANLFALEQVRDMSKGRAALLLSQAGFSTREVAALLLTSESSIRGMLSMARRRGFAEE
jgi:transposase